MSETRYNLQTEKFEECVKCDRIPLDSWQNAKVSLGPAEWSAVLGQVMRVGENTMRGQLMVNWTLDGAPFSVEWHHPHELERIPAEVTS